MTPEQIYEQNKMRNFAASSRLEGIDLPSSDYVDVGVADDGLRIMNYGQGSMTISVTVGDSGLSIPTAIPIEETIMTDGIEKLPGDIYINLKTLTRNFLNTLTREMKEILADMPTSLPAGIISNEMLTIREMVASRFQGERNVHFYLTEHQKLAFKFPKAVWRVPKTEGQKLEVRLMTSIVEAVMEQHADMVDVTEVKVNGKGAGIILTHQPIDLLSRYEFSNLVLLESHTGKIKTPGYWGTKLKTKGADTLPFNPLTLLVFGDGDLFLGFPRKSKQMLLDLARDRKWSPVTSNTKIAEDLGRLNDQPMTDLYREILRTRL